MNDARAFPRTTPACTAVDVAGGLRTLVRFNVACDDAEQALAAHVSAITSAVVPALRDLVIAAPSTRVKGYSPVFA
jgi:hypothetical protein